MPGAVGSEAAAATSPRLCCPGEAAAADTARGLGLSLGFENTGLGSSLGAGEGSTFAGVLWVGGLSVPHSLAAHRLGFSVALHAR